MVKLKYRPNLSPGRKMKFFCNRSYAVRTRMVLSFRFWKWKVIHYNIECPKMDMLSCTQNTWCRPLFFQLRFARPDTELIMAVYRNSCAVCPIILFLFSDFYISEKRQIFQGLKTASSHVTVASRMVFCLFLVVGFWPVIKSWQKIWNLFVWAHYQTIYQSCAYQSFVRLTFTPVL